MHAMSDKIEIGVWVARSVFIAFFAVCSTSFADAACANANFAADAFVSKWNERVAADKLGPAWRLEKYNRLGFIRANLDGTSLLLVARVDKTGCIAQLDIKSRRADADGYAALVAWSSVIFATNPSLPKEQRKAVLTALGLDKPRAGGSFTANGVIYEFFENGEINDFSARPK